MTRTNALLGGVLFLSLAVVGCFGGSAVGIGPCTLRVTADEQGQWRVLEEPYSVRMSRPDQVPSHGHTALIFSGTGWHQMEVVLRHASRTSNTGRLTSQDIQGETTGFPLDQPGTWEVQLSDEVTGCRRAFAVEVIQ